MKLKMNVQLEDNKMSLGLKILYISILIICVISIVIAFVVQMSKDNELSNPKDSVEVGDKSEYIEKFDNMFNNKVNYLKKNSYKVSRLKQEYGIIYTGYENKDNKINNYTLDVSVPYINIENETIEEYNKEIKDTFEKKAKSILNNTQGNTIYTVKYCANVSNNILSLVIRSTLKEGDTPQRDIIQTYNYDLTNQKEYTIKDAIESRGITKQDANKTIKEEISNIQRINEEYEKMGYSVYPRDSKSEIYSINNVKEFFIGEDQEICIIFAYGNENNTNEKDLVVM